MPSQHELSDANAKSIMWVAVISLVLGALILIVIGAIFFHLKSYLETRSQAKAPAALIVRPKQNPPPLFEINSKATNKALLKKQRQLLNSYGWLDQQQGLARIPVEKAIEILSHEY